MQRLQRGLEMIAAGFVGAVFTSVVVVAWAGPTSAPPNGNAAAPINIGATAQVKNGGLSVNTLAVFGNGTLTGNFGINNTAPTYRLDVSGSSRVDGNLLLSGASRYLNFGAATGTSGYGIRDNAGTLQFKNSSGSWSSFLPSSGVVSITFIDGTVQTTAAVAVSPVQTTVSCTTASTGGSRCTTANCPSGYVRTGCSAYRSGDAVTAGARPIGTAACECANQYVGSPGTSCYTYCLKF